MTTLEVTHGAFHYLHTHLGGGGGVKPLIQCYCVLHVKMGEGRGRGSRKYVNYEVLKSGNIGNIREVYFRF